MTNLNVWYLMSNLNVSDSIAGENTVIVNCEISETLQSVAYNLN